MTTKKTLKEFVIEESVRCGKTANTIYCRILYGRYPNLKLERKNQRVVFVLNQTTDFVPQLKVEPKLHKRPKVLFV